MFGVEQSNFKVHHYTSILVMVLYILNPVDSVNSLVFLYNSKVLITATEEFKTMTSLLQQPTSVNYVTPYNINTNIVTNLIKNYLGAHTNTYNLII
jgi:hypothetical protein